MDGSHTRLLYLNLNLLKNVITINTRQYNKSSLVYPLVLRWGGLGCCNTSGHLGMCYHFCRQCYMMVDATGLQQSMKIFHTVNLSYNENNWQDDGVSILHFSSVGKSQDTK